MFKRILLLLILFFLFYLSSTSQILVSDPSTWTNGQHRDPSTDLTHLLDEDSAFFKTYFEDDRTVDDLDFEFYIRKLFHIGAYALLSLVIFWNLPKSFLRYFWSFLLAVCVSFADETNQYLTFGRSGRLWDVYLDSTAALVSLLFLFLIRLLMFVFSWIKKSRQVDTDSNF